MGSRFRTSSPLLASADFRRQVEDLRPYLLRYASLQLRDRAAAEDAVQEALFAALAGEANFAGRANLRTWLTGILKHKIVDTIRRQSRERSAADPKPRATTASSQPVDKKATDGNADAWQRRKAAKAIPRRAGRLLRALPERTARVFMMREQLARHVKSVRNSASPRRIAGCCCIARAWRAPQPANELVQS